MSLELFKIALGLDIEAADASSHANILQGPGTPGGDGAEQDAAPIGSVFLRTDVETNNLQMYYKYRTTQNAFGDWETVASSSLVNAAINGVSWRDPVTVIDNTPYAALAALPVGGVVDGVTLSDGDRVLFTDITGSNNNVYIWDSTLLTWTEDTNLATDGDTVLGQDGTAAEQQWTFDGTTWVQTGGASNANELAFIRDFIGKNGTGSETPLYTSATNVTQGVSLEAAIGELDAQIGAESFTENNFVNPANTINQNIDGLDVQLGDGTHSSVIHIADVNDVTENLAALDVAIGTQDFTNTANHLLDLDNAAVGVSLEKLNVGIGSLNYTNGYNVTNGQTITQTFDNLDIALGDTNHASTNIISNAASVNSNLSVLDAAIGDRAYTNDFVVTDGETTTASIDALDSQLGNNVFTESNIVSGGNNITQNLDALDVVVNTNAAQSAVIKTGGVAAQTAIDSIPVASAEIAKWIIGYENTGDATNRETVEVHALTDGTTVKFDKYSIRRFGNVFPGLVIDCDINAGSLRLLLTSATTVDVAVKRVGFYTIN